MLATVLAARICDYVMISFHDYEQDSYLLCIDASQALLLSLLLYDQEWTSMLIKCQAHRITDPWGLASPTNPGLPEPKATICHKSLLLHPSQHPCTSVYYNHPKLIDND